MPVLRYRLRRTDGPGGGRFASAAELADAVSRSGPSARPGARRLRRLHGRRTPAPVGRAPSCRPPSARGSKWPLRRTGRVESGVRRLDLREPQGRRRSGAPTGHEFKLIFPQAGATPDRFEALDFQHFFLQPMDGPDRERNTQLAVRVLPRPPPVAAESPDPQAAGYPVR